MRRILTVLTAGLLLSTGVVVAAGAFRAGIPFGSAGSWNTAVNNDPSATQGVWFDANGHSYSHSTDGLDHQLDLSNYSVNAAGAKCNGSFDDTSAFQAVAAAAPANSTINLPCNATCVITDTVVFTKDRQFVKGCGFGSTIIKFNPATPKAAIRFDNGGAVDRMYGGGISGIFFSAGNTTVQKIAIDLVDTSGVYVRDIWVDPTNSASTPWHTTFTNGGGTIAVNNGSASVTGTGTNFTSALIGQYIEIVGIRYHISAIGSTTAMTLEKTYDGINASGLTYATGLNSIGIRLRGREMTLIENIRAWGDTPIAIQTDPYINNPVNCDHLHIRDTYLLSRRNAGTACISTDDGLIVTNTILDGDNAWVVDKYGWYWVDTGTEAANSQNILISGIRMEQFADTTPYGFYWVRGKGLQNVMFQNIQMSSFVNGFWLDGGAVSGMDWVTLENILLSNASASYTSISTLGSVRNFATINVLTNTGALVNFGTNTRTFSIPQQQNTYPAPSTAFYLDSAAATHTGQLTTNITYATNTFTNTSAANTNPWTEDTTIDFTAGNSIHRWKTAGTQVADIDGAGNFNNNGSLRYGGSGTGTLDTAGAIQLQAGANNATSVALGRAGASGVFIVAPTIACGSAGGCTAGGAGLYFSRDQSRHFEGGGSAPSTPTAGTGCNTSSAANNAGTDASGTFGITCGGTGATASTILTMNFNTSYSSAPNCTASPANAATAALAVAQIPFVTTSTTAITMTSNGTGLAAGTYLWRYSCIM